MPSTELLAAMGKFNEELVKAGMMEAGEGLHPTSKGARIKYAGGQGSATRGPFPLSNDLVSGFWLIKVNSLDDAIDWMKRAPFDGGAEIEIRQVFETEDFGEAFTPELREQESAARRREVATASGPPAGLNPESRYAISRFRVRCFASPRNDAYNKETHHAIHDADDPPGL